MNLQDKITTHFEGRVVRKDLSKIVKGNAVVPTYVLEYLLGQHCASSDEEIIKNGLEKVRTILSKHFVHRDEAEVIKAAVREKGSHNIIDKVTAKLNEQRDQYEATFSNLGISKVPVGDQIIKQHPKLLTGGVWSIINLGYMFSEERNSSPWLIESLKPIQISHVDIESYKEQRQAFTTEEWMDLLLQSIGFNPEFFTFRDKLIQLTRLIPFCENNYNLIELGPKGTGKSHIFSELSPHGILISGGDVTQAKLFVNNTTGNIGLVGYWDSIAFDEFAGTQKRVDKQLVDIMKNYLANKTFSRGRDVQGAQASMVFIGNTDHTVAYMLKHSNLFDALPPAYYDSAFLDRIHTYLPGWEVKKLRTEMLTDGYGFIVDYLAEVLRELRKEDFGHLIKEHFVLSDTLTTRDRTAVQKTFSGLVKIIYPHGACTQEEQQMLLEFALECRKRVKDQLVKMDHTFEEVDFNLRDMEGRIYTITPLEYLESGIGVEIPVAELTETKVAASDAPVHGRHIVTKENQKGISYEKLFGPILPGAKYVHLFDPFLLHTYQVKNLVEFCAVLLKYTEPGSETKLTVITRYDEGDALKHPKAKELHEQVRDAFEGTDLKIEFEYPDASSQHDRSVETDTGWKVTLGRGLDIFQVYEWKNALGLETNVQEMRACKAFEVTYLRVGK